MNDTKVRGNQPAADGYKDRTHQARLGNTAATVIVIALLALAAALIWIVANDPSILPGIDGPPVEPNGGTKDPGIIGK